MVLSILYTYQPSLHFLLLLLESPKSSATVLQEIQSNHIRPYRIFLALVSVIVLLDYLHIYVKTFSLLLNLIFQHI